MSNFDLPWILLKFSEVDCKTYWSFEIKPRKILKERISGIMFYLKFLLWLCGSCIYNQEHLVFESFLGIMDGHISADAGNVEIFIIPEETGAKNLFIASQ